MNTSPAGLTLVTDRDLDVLAILAVTALTAEQICKVSKTFAHQFPDPRQCRRVRAGRPPSGRPGAFGLPPRGPGCRASAGHGARGRPCRPMAAARRRSWRRVRTASRDDSIDLSARRMGLDGRRSPHGGNRPRPPATTVHGARAPAAAAALPGATQARALTASRAPGACGRPIMASDTPDDGRRQGTRRPLYRGERTGTPNAESRRRVSPSGRPTTFEYEPISPLMRSPPRPWIAYAPALSSGSPLAT